MENYRNLKIYQESRKLGIDVHNVSLLLPKFELYETGSQIRRSAKAVAALIIEGYARRRYKNDFIKYLVYSIAECDETVVHLDFLYETKSLKDKELYEQLRKRLIDLSKKINAYTKWVDQKFVWTPDI